MKYYKLFLPITVIVFFLAYLSWQYIDFLKSKKDMFERESHALYASQMQKTVSEMILVQHKSILAIALSVANDEKLVNNIAANKIDAVNYENLISKLRENTLYKDIWIQIFDKDANALYRSWSEKKGDNLFEFRKDLQNVIRTNKIVTSINPGKHDLSIRAIVPLHANKEFIGMVEIVSHFNSITKSLKSSDADSVVLLKKEYTSQLKYPATKLFIGDYYVANMDAPLALREHLRKNGVENYLNNSYKIENNKIIVSCELKDITSVPIGYIIMSKEISSISNIDVDFYMFKWIVFSILVLTAAVVILSGLLFYAKAKDRIYYKNIINTSNNIIITYNRYKMLEVNKTFLKYFSDFNSLEQFISKHTCVCYYFMEEKGCLREEVDGVNWIDYLIKHTDSNHKVKMKIFEKEYYFTISASNVSKEKDHIAVIMADITEEENYKKELEHLTITDPLTGIGNRRYFQQKIEDECSRAKRYGFPLSLLICDIDFFKQVNDKYGHNVGDEVLIEYSQMISSLLRENDIFCRIGGEEFVLILPHTSLTDSKNTAEKLRKSIESSKKIIPITMSFGVVDYIKGEDVESIFKRADKALYEAKEQGRNRVVVG